METFEKNNINENKEKETTMFIANVEDAKTFLQKVMGGRFHAYYNPVGVKQSGGKMPPASMLGSNCLDCWLDDDFEQFLYLSTTLIGDEAFEGMVGLTIDLDRADEEMPSLESFIGNLIDKAYKTKAARDKAWEIVADEIRQYI